MKIMIAYPPLNSDKGIPLLSQNRQFQWFRRPTYIYPVVPAYAATMLKNKAHEIIWADGIASGLSEEQFLALVSQTKPDLMMIETKTPVVKRHWKFINYLKARQPRIKIILVGDHVTALPKESFDQSLVDFVLTGGDYDFLLLNLVESLQPQSLELNLDHLEKGVYFRQNGKVYTTGKFELSHDLNQLPMIDRDLTEWQLYAYKNGNFKNNPGTYIMAGRDCWWGKCSFCSWRTLYPTFRFRSVENVLKEIELLVTRYQIKEIMDDTGTFPTGKWLEDFCQAVIKRRLNQKVTFNCNLRFGILEEKDYFLLAQAGFRLLLFGLESANQETLDKINKGIKLDKIIQELEWIKKAQGHLEPHLTFMLGYPWETEPQAQKTINFARQLFQKGLIDSLQASVIIPYPGTSLFEQAKENGWLKTEDWENYDMSKPVLKSPLRDSEIFSLIRNLYRTALTPQFILRKILSIRSWIDLKFLARSSFALWGHLKDFVRNQKSRYEIKQD
jgi:radical SAM superfamily enzyme YgiQ (UPF0313 family)